MDLATFSKIDPSNFQRIFLSRSDRADGRSLSSCRKPSLNVNILKNCSGSACLRSRASFYIAGIKAEICSNFPNPSQAKGRVIPSIQFSRKAEVFKDALGPSKNYLINVNSLLSNFFNSEKVLNHSKLVISQDPPVAWVLYLNISCLEYDGNLTDLAVIVGGAALESCKLPEVAWDSKEKWWRINDKAAVSQSSDSSEELAAMLRCGDELLLGSNGIADDATPLNPDSAPKQGQKGPNMLNHGNEKVLKQRVYAITLAHVLNEFWLVDPTRQEEELGVNITIYRIGDSDWFLSGNSGTGSIPLLEILSSDLQNITLAIVSGYNAIIDKAMESVQSSL